MKGRITDKVRVQHILECIEEIQASIGSQTYADFQRDNMLRRTLERCLEIIGEAAHHISEETKMNYTDIDWINIKGLRNNITHEYWGVDYKKIWEASTVLIKLLKPQMEEIFNKLN